MLKFYVNPDTQTIHMVQDFPSPKRNGFSPCGQILTKMLPCSERLADVAPFRLCIRCRQLTGV